MMRSLRMAICTSGEPVSVSWRRYSAIVACLSGMWGIDLWNRGGGRRTGHVDLAMVAGSAPDGQTPGPEPARSRPGPDRPGRLLVGARMTSSTLRPVEAG